MRRNEVRVMGVTYSPGSGTVVLILEEVYGDRILPVWIGEFEGSSIDMALRGIRSARPLPYDLLITAVEKLGGNVRQVLVCQLKENTFYATVEIQRNSELFQVDSRPSDAVAIALRTHAPIFVTEEVLMEAGYPKKFLKRAFEGEEERETPLREDELEKFKEFIARVKPEDFKRFTSEE